MMAVLLTAATRPVRFLIALQAWTAFVLNVKSVPTVGLAGTAVNEAERDICAIAPGTNGGSSRRAVLRSLASNAAARSLGWPLKRVEPMDGVRSALGASDAVPMGEAFVDRTLIGRLVPVTVSGFALNAMRANSAPVEPP